MPFIKFFIVFLVCFKLSFGNVKNFQNNLDFQAFEGFLSQIKTLEGEVTQTFQGKSQAGNFTIKLPSKFRVEYSEGLSPYIMVVNGGTMTYYDKSLEQKSQIPTPKNISIFFENSLFSLRNPNIKILDFNTDNQKIALKFQVKGNENGGTIEAFFRKTPEGFEIEKLEAENKTPNGVEKIITTFKNVRINPNISDKIFIINNKNIDTKFNF
jgi:outer membrane lipoprotein-sorting protein